MGEKYLLDDYELKDADYDFREEYSTDQVNVYENDKAFPLVYGRQDTIPMAELNQLQFPYTMDCFMNYVITDYQDPEDWWQYDSKSDYNDNGRLQAYAQDRIKDRYTFNLSEGKEYTIDLQEPIKDKYLIITFKVNQEKYQDLKICINDSRRFILMERKWKKKL